MESMIGYDFTFELNEFNQPRIRSEIELLKNAILFILFAKKGQYPSLPTLGLDIRKKLYSHYDDLDVDELKQEIINQCSILGNFFDNGIIDITKTLYQQKPTLIILISGKETFPDGYLKDNVGSSGKYLIGITLDELNKLVSDIKKIY